jgi:hypothetical protein
VVFPAEEIGDGLVQRLFRLLLEPFWRQQRPRYGNQVGADLGEVDLQVLALLLRLLDCRRGKIVIYPGLDARVAELLGDETGIADGAVHSAEDEAYGEESDKDDSQQNCQDAPNDNHAGSLPVG